MRRIRELLGLTQVQLAIALGVDVETVIALESGATAVTGSWAKRIRDVAKRRVGRRWNVCPPPKKKLVGSSRSTSRESQNYALRNSAIAVNAPLD